MINRSRFITLVAIASLSACGGTPQVPNRPIAQLTHTPDAAVTGRLDSDPDLNPKPPQKLLSIDWPRVTLSSEVEALTLWRQIAPSGDDFQDKLAEIPDTHARPLAIALLHGGNFKCTPPPPPDCAAPQFDVPTPAPTAGLDDPCLRRNVALWALDQLEPEDIPKVLDVLRAVAALPPPESELIVAALDALPETNFDGRLELLAIASKNGQRELADTHLGDLDEAHLKLAVQKHHIGGALEVLAAEAHRAVYLTAINDEALAGGPRAKAILELAATADPKLPRDLTTALGKAAGSADCAVAGAAIRALELHGDRSRIPKRPRTQSPATMMRALCVLASYEQLQRADEPSLLATYVPPKGLERVEVTYVSHADGDPDGDGDPHTEHQADLIDKRELVVPEIEELSRAMRRCKGTTCTTNDREFHFSFKSGGDGLLLARIELVERPPCTP